MEENFFRLDERIDADWYLKQIDHDKWIDYREFSDVSSGYYGISLMQKENSSTPELDSLTVFADDDSEVNIIREDIPDGFKHFLSLFTVPISKARLAKITSKGYLPPHIDRGYENITRLHFPLQTSNNSYWHWYENNKRVDTLQLESGYGYAMNTNVMHSVQNKDKTDRIHLVINVDMSYRKLTSLNCHIIPESIYSAS